jgi:hypothetical protein
VRPPGVRRQTFMPSGSGRVLSFCLRAVACPYLRGRVLGPTSLAVTHAPRGRAASLRNNPVLYRAASHGDGLAPAVTSQKWHERRAVECRQMGSSV